MSSASGEPLTRTIAIAATEWKFQEAGVGADTLVSLPGALGEAGMHWEAFRPLLAERRVIALSYPAIDSMTLLCDGLAELLDRLGAARVDLLGQSFGGYVAQCFARRHPARVRHLILSHSFVLRPNDAARLRIGARLVTKIPGGLFRWSLAARTRSVLEPLRRAGHPSYRAWRARLDAWARSPETPAAVRRINLMMAESLTNMPPSDRPAPAGVTIIESDDDPIIRASSRAALRTAFPGADVRTFHGTGHISALADPAGYAEALKRALSDTTDR